MVTATPSRAAMRVLRCDKAGAAAVASLVCAWPAVPQSRRKKTGRSAMDARTSRYHDVYARWQRDPEGFWGEAAHGDRLVSRSRRKSSTRTPGIYGRWFAGGACNTCYNALDRHVANGRNDQPALIYDSPGHQHRKTFTYGRMLSEVQIARRHAARLRRRQGRPRHPLYADGAGGGVRHAGLRAHRRHPLGGVRRLRGRRSWPPASTTPSRS